MLAARAWMIHADLARGNVCRYSDTECALANALPRTPRQVRRRRRGICKLTVFFHWFCSELGGVGDPESCREGTGAGRARPPIRAQPAAHINPPLASAPDSATAAWTERCSGSSPPLLQRSRAGKHQEASDQAAGRLGTGVQVPWWPRLRNVPSLAATTEGASRIRVPRRASVQWGGSLRLGPRTW